MNQDELSYHPKKKDTNTKDNNFNNKKRKRRFIRESIRRLY